MLQNQLLIAMPDIDETIFSRSVVLICEHNEHGAIGLIVNRPLAFSLSFVFDELGIASNDNAYDDKALLFGGPMQQERGFVIHKPYEGMTEALDLSESVSVSTKMTVLRGLAEGKGPEIYQVALGFCAWDAGQLDEEIKANLWLTLEASSELLYNVPFESRWESAGKNLGINLNLISSDTGHG